MCAIVQSKELHLYTFENRCNENTELLLGDESTKVILTPEGQMNDVSSELSEFLDYLAGKGGNSTFVQKLEAAVDKAKNKEEWRMEYMTLLMRDREKFEQGLEQGREQERCDAIRRLLQNNCARDFILSLGYTEEELAEATVNAEEFYLEGAPKGKTTR